MLHYSWLRCYIRGDGLGLVQNLNFRCHFWDSKVRLRSGYGSVHMSVWTSYQIFMVFMYICLLIPRKRNGNIRSHPVCLSECLTNTCHLSSNSCISQCPVHWPGRISDVSAVLLSCLLDCVLCLYRKERYHMDASPHLSLLYPWQSGVTPTTSFKGAWQRRRACAINCLNGLLTTKTRIKHSCQM